MAIDETVVRHLEQLASLRLDDDERQRLAARLARVVAYVEQLRELDTSSVAPGATSSVTPGLAPGVTPGLPPKATAGDVAAPRRPDDPLPSLPVTEATALSPAAERGLFVVPPVLGGNDG
jgi:Asp-tRNA(Asn)/Glu-tRNA(Gln) amidotransferase C subunit